MSYRFNAKQIFLTYSQCTLTKERVLEFFDERWTLEGHCVSKENHADGGTHIHAYFRFTRKLDLTGPRVFDIDGFHPNVVPNVRSPKKCLEYVQKDGDFIASADIVAMIEKSGPKKTWKDLVEECTTRSDFMRAAFDYSPRDFVLNLERIEYFANYHYRDAVPEYVQPDYDWNVPTALTDWAEINVRARIPGERPKSLILVGPSRIGKTTWARSLGSHMYMGGGFNLDDWKSDVEYLVCDDITWQYFPNKTFATLIRDNIALAEAPSFGQDIYEYKPDSKGAEDYTALCDEIIKQETRVKK